MESRPDVKIIRINYFHLVNFEEETMASRWNSVLILTLLISSSFQVALGFEKPCDDSDSTIEIVQFCPTSEQTFKDAAEKKNCAAIPNKCESFVYHCVRNRQKNALIEVCAPWLYIVDHVCGTYHEEFHSIRRTEEPCNARDNCPYRYKSTDQFKYQSCYQLASSSTVPAITTHHRYTTMETTLPRDPKETNKDGKEERQECSEFVPFSYAFGAALGSALGLSCIWCIIRVFRKLRSKVDLNSVAGCSCKDHFLTKKLSPHDEQLTVDGVMNDDENQEQTLDQSTNVRHTQTAFNMKYTADIEERDSSLDDSPNVTIYDSLLVPFRISRSLTPELRIQVPTPTPEPDVLNINSVTEQGTELPKCEHCGRGDALKQLSKIHDTDKNEKLIEELQSKIKKLEEENSKLKEREKIIN